MARKQTIITTLIDDLDGSEIEKGNGETVKFALDGSSYEIDLSADNASELRDKIAPYVSKARRAGRAARTTSSTSRFNSSDLAAAREWLRSNGHEVGDRGRIPNNLMELYRSSK